MVLRRGEVASVQKLAQEMNEGLKRSGLRYRKERNKEAGCPPGFYGRREEVGDKAAIGDGDGNGRVITRISEGKSIAASQS